MGLVGKPDNIREGGYQPISDPPAPPTGPVPQDAVNPLTGASNGTAPAQRPTQDQAPEPDQP